MKPRIHVATAEEAMAILRHDRHSWVETGRREPHTNVALLCGRQPRIAFYCRCATCGQDGFQYRPSPIIYTWRNV